MIDNCILALACNCWASALVIDLSGIIHCCKLSIFESYLASFSSQDIIFHTSVLIWLCGNSYIAFWIGCVPISFSSMNKYLWSNVFFCSSSLFFINLELTKKSPPVASLLAFIRLRFAKIDLAFCLSSTLSQIEVPNGFHLTGS